MKPETREGRAELLEQLSRAIDLRSSQDQVLWSIFGFFGATNAVLLVALFQDGDFPNDPWLVAVLVAAGLLVSLAWGMVQRRAIGHIERHEALMERIERKLQVPLEFAVSRKIDPDTATHVGKGTPARKVMAAAGWASGVLWAGVLLILLGKKCGCI